MAKKPQDMPTSTLMHYQTLIGMANEQMDEFATQMRQERDKGNISTSFYESTVRKLQPKVDKNTEILSSIDKEIYARVAKDLPGSTSTKIMNDLYREFFKEREDHKSSLEKRKKEVINLTTDKKKE